MGEEIATALDPAVMRAAREALRGVDVERATILGRGWDVVAWRLPAPCGDWVLRVPRLVAGIARFLSALPALDPAEAVECGAVPYEPWPEVYAPMIARCASLLPPRTEAWIRRTGEQLERVSTPLPSPVVLHADLKPAHVLVDEAFALRGVLDFEGARVSDAALDFSRLVQH